jgi:hypothetical protein
VRGWQGIIPRATWSMVADLGADDDLQILPFLV